MKSPRAPPLRTRIFFIARLRGGRARRGSGRGRGLVGFEGRGAGSDLEFHFELHRQAVIVLRDPKGSERPYAPGLADLLWAITMKPEFQLIY